MLQAMIEDTPVNQAGDMTSDMRFLAIPVSHQHDPALMTGTLLQLLTTRKFGVDARSAIVKLLI